MKKCVSCKAKAAILIYGAYRCASCAVKIHYPYRNGAADGKSKR